MELVGGFTDPVGGFVLPVGGAGLPCATAQLAQASTVLKTAIVRVDILKPPNLLEKGDSINHEALQEFNCEGLRKRTLSVGCLRKEGDFTTCPPRRASSLVWSAGQESFLLAGRAQRKTSRREPVLRRRR